MRTLSHIEGCEWILHDNGCVTVDAFMRVDTDGTGDHHGDKTAQGETTYKPNLNADRDKFVVVPGKIRKGVGPVVIGCRVVVEDLHTNKVLECVAGDVGPNNRSGEVARCVAIFFGLNPDPNRGGWDESPRFRYTFYPGVAASGYHLCPA